MRGVTTQRSSFVLSAILLTQCAQYAHADVVSLDASYSCRIYRDGPDALNDPGVLSVYHPKTYIEHRSLIRFDLDSIPPGATINSAELRLVTHDDLNKGWKQDNLDYTTVHAVTKAWIEAEMTWNRAATGDPWNSPGGDYSAAVATNNDDVIGAGHTLTWNITTLVSEWTNGSRENYGVLLQSSLWTTLHFYSHRDSANGPRLIVDYDYVANEAPVANAGPDQEHYAEASGAKLVTLDGSDSSDPDSSEGTNDDVVSFRWYEADTLLGEGETLEVSLDRGQHAVTLEVEDTAGETDTEEVLITILNNPPVADASATADEVISANGEDASVTLDASLSYDLEVDVLTYTWLLNGEEIATGEIASALLPVGENEIVLRVGDGADTAETSLAVTIVTTGQATENLAEEIYTSEEYEDIPAGTANSLVSSLEAAADSFHNGNTGAGVNKLRAFQNKVDAQSGKKIDGETAAQLISLAQEIIDAALG